MPRGQGRIEKFTMAPEWMRGTQITVTYKSYFTAILRSELAEGEKSTILTMESHKNDL